MARNYISVKEVVNDFLLTLSEDDYVSNVADYHVYQLALRGIREMGFDVMKRVKSIALDVTSINTVELPDDFVGLLRIGAEGGDGLLYSFKENKNISTAQQYVTDSAGNRIDSNGDGVFDREESDKVQSINTENDLTAEHRQSLYEGSMGRAYGHGGGQGFAQYRVNYEQNRIELASGIAFDEVVVEYIADEARSENPSVHIYAEEALRYYIYLKLVQRKANVPAGEKQLARQNYYNELRIAKARMNAFSKEEALNVIRKNFKQSPKY